MKYVIDSKIYENHIKDEVHLYGLLHQLAFLAGKVEDDEDMEDLIEMATRYGVIAEEKFRSWHIPGRYLVFGDRADLAEKKAAELVPLNTVLKEHDREQREKERAAALRDPAYIISGGSFRLLVSDLFSLLGQYVFSATGCGSLKRRHSSNGCKRSSPKKTRLCAGYTAAGVSLTVNLSPAAI